MRKLARDNARPLHGHAFGKKDLVSSPHAALVYQVRSGDGAGGLRHHDGTGDRIGDFRVAAAEEEAVLERDFAQLFHDLSRLRGAGLRGEKKRSEKPSRGRPRSRQVVHIDNYRIVADSVGGESHRIGFQNKHILAVELDSGHVFADPRRDQKGRINAFAQEASEQLVGQFSVPQGRVQSDDILELLEVPGREIRRMPECR